MKKYLLVICLCSTFYSCIKPCSLDRGSLINSSILIYPFNTAANEYFHPQLESDSPYRRDSLKVLDEEGKSYPFVRFLPKQDPRNALRIFYAIQASPAFRIPKDNDAFNVEKTRKMYLQYNHNTADTLTLVFKGKKLKCVASEYEYLKIYHRSKLIFSATSGISADFTLNH